MEGQVERRASGYWDQNHLRLGAGPKNIVVQRTLVYVFFCYLGRLFELGQYSGLLVLLSLSVKSTPGSLLVPPILVAAPVMVTVLQFVLSQGFLGGVAVAKPFAEQLAVRHQNQACIESRQFLNERRFVKRNTVAASCGEPERNRKIAISCCLPFSPISSKYKDIPIFNVDADCYFFFHNTYSVEPSSQEP